MEKFLGRPRGPPSSSSRAHRVPPTPGCPVTRRSSHTHRCLDRGTAGDLGKWRHRRRSGPINVLSQGWEGAMLAGRLNSGVIAGQGRFGPLSQESGRAAREAVGRRANQPLPRCRTTREAPSTPWEDTETPRETCPVAWEDAPDSAARRHCVERVSELALPAATPVCPQGRWGELPSEATETRQGLGRPARTGRRTTRPMRGS